MHLDKEQAFYEANKDELRLKYSGKRVVIASNKILGVYDSDREALQTTVKTMPRGSFMVKYIPENPQKEKLPILITLFGMVTLVMLLLSLKA